MHISTLNHFLTHKNVKFKQELVDGETFTIVSYMIADPKFWQIPDAIECRGITFNSSGECVSRPFHKFFNLGENDAVRVEKLNFDNVSFEEKRDGSMITGIVTTSGKVFLKTKKSFYSDVAIDAQKNMTKEVEYIIKDCNSKGQTAIFEYTSPNNQVVIDYGKEPQFVLLAIRDNNTGEYVDINQYLIIKKPIKYETSIQEVLANSSTIRGIEGYVITLSDGFTKVKHKTDWYNSLHHVMTELRERDVAVAVVKEVVDDMKASVVAHGKDVAIIEEIENRVIQDLFEIQSKTLELLKLMSLESSKKDIAMKYKNNEYFSLAIRWYDGSEPDYDKFWDKFYKQKYTFRTVYNPSFSGDES